MALKRWSARLTPLDRGVLLILLLATVAMFRLQGNQEPGRRVIVERGEEVLYSAPLVNGGIFSFGGPLGETRLEIRDGSARILDSPCPHKDCMAMGAVSRQGELIACVPNRLLVRIEGGGGSDGHYDLLSR